MDEIESPTLARNEWVNLPIKEKLKAAGEDNAACSWRKVSIYRVPQYLRDPSDHKAYTPQVVSLGPYHHDKGRLKQMERHKWRALQCILRRNNQDIELYLDSMMQLESEARACYQGPLKRQLTSTRNNKFAEMMLLDGCFILEILQGAAYGFETLGYDENDPIFSRPGIIPSIKRDMIMLENQIPLFVLDRLLELDDPDQKGRTAQLAIAFYNRLMPGDEKMQKDLPLPDPGSFHFLDVIRRSCSYKGPTVPGPKRQEPIHRVTELKDAGIKIKKREADRLWDINFDNGTLSIPPILIQDGTKSFLQNLIAFEQCHLGCKKDISSYVVFLDNLIDTAEDIRCLHYHGIIKHWLGSDKEVANLFNCLGKEVVIDIRNSNFAVLSMQINKYYYLNEHYHRKLNNWRTTLKERYFKNPWTIISLLAAVLLLLLTAIQTFYGVYSYHVPNN